jgi:hypothetical protein
VYWDVIIECGNRSETRIDIVTLDQEDGMDGLGRGWEGDLQFASQGALEKDSSLGVAKTSNSSSFNSYSL